MAQTTIVAGDSVNQAASYSGGNDGTLKIQTGPNGAKVDALNISATGVVRLLDAGFPAFSAYQSTLQTLSNSTQTKISLQTKEFDTAAAFDSTTNYRFTPQVAGYYQVIGCVGLVSSTGTYCSIYKNGTIHKSGPYATAFTLGVSAIVSMNGTTDYVELYAIQTSGGGVNTNTGAANTYFQAHLLRAT